MHVRNNEKWYHKWTIWKTDWWKEIYSIINEWFENGLMERIKWYLKWKIWKLERNPAVGSYPSIFSLCSASAFIVWRLILGGGLWLGTWLKLGRVSDFFFPSRRWKLSAWKPHWYSGFVRSSPGCRKEAAGPPLKVWFDLIWRSTEIYTMNCIVHYELHCTIWTVLYTLLYCVIWIIVYTKYWNKHYELK